MWILHFALNFNWTIVVKYGIFSFNASKVNSGLPFLAREISSKYTLSYYALVQHLCHEIYESETTKRLVQITPLSFSASRIKLKSSTDVSDKFFEASHSLLYSFEAYLAPPSQRMVTTVWPGPICFAIRYAPATLRAADPPVITNIRNFAIILMI